MATVTHARARASLAVLAVALVAGGCIIERTQSPPSVGTEFATSFTLTADQPVAVRTIEFAAEPGSQPVSQVAGYVEVVGEGGGGPGGTPHHDVWVSILNAETGASADAEHGNGHASVDGWGHAVSCAGGSTLEVDARAPEATAPCTARWTVIARWLHPVANVEIPLELNARLSAGASIIPPEGEEFTLDRLSIAEVDGLSHEGPPSVSRATATGSATVTPTSAPETRSFVLRVPAVLLADPAAFPRLGRLFLGSEVTEWSGPPANLRLRAAVGDRATNAYGSIAGELDWLSLCEPGTDCELPIDVTVEPWLSSGIATPPPDGSMSIDWDLEVRLEDFSTGAALPAEIELVEVP